MIKDQGPESFPSSLGNFLDRSDVRRFLDSSSIDLKDKPLLFVCLAVKKIVFRCLECNKMLF